MKWLFDFYINSSIHVAISVAALSLVSTLHYGLRPDPLLLIFIFLGTVTGYNFVKYAAVAGLHHRSLTSSLRQIQIFSFVSLILLFVILFFIPREVLIWSAFMALMTLLYAIPVFHGDRNLRRIPGLKILVIALVWAIVTGVFPALLHPIPALAVLLESLQKFFFVLALILPFEIRDMRYDEEGLRTLPQVIGVSRTRMVGLMLLLLVLILELMKHSTSLASLVAVAVVVAVTATGTLASRVKQSRYYASFWVESIPLLWFLSLYCLRSW